MLRGRLFFWRAATVLLAALMAAPVVPAAGSGPESPGGVSPRLTDDAYDLIVPEGTTYELFGCHTYSRSVRIDGRLNVTPYDGLNETKGTLLLQAPLIVVGTVGIIVANGRGYGGGGGSSEAENGGMGGIGGIGGAGASNSGGGGGGGSCGGPGGASGVKFTGSSFGTEASGGKGGDALSTPFYLGGAGGHGFGGGGGGGAGGYGFGGGGGGGGSGGITSISRLSGGDGAGAAYGKGGVADGGNGGDGGYATAGSNGDTSVELNISKGSGGGGGAAGNFKGSGGGGGAGGGSVALLSLGDIYIEGVVSAVGGGGGMGGEYRSVGGAGGGGAGGGILLSGMNVSVTGTIDTRGRSADNLSITNGGTVKVFYAIDGTGAGDIQAGRIYKNGRPRMQGLISPENGTTAPLRPTFKWYDAPDPEMEPVTYHLQVSTAANFATMVLENEGINGTEYTINNDLLKPVFYWRVRARDAWGYGDWSPIWSFFTDKTPPDTHVNALLQYSNSTNFTVSWTGTDDSSGVIDYDIFVADGKDSLDFIPWLEDTCKTSAVFGGKEAHRYNFYSVGIDRALNRELEPARPDSYTIVDTIPPFTTMGALAPYQGSQDFQISWSGKDDTSGIQYYDVFAASGESGFERRMEHTNSTSARFEAEDGMEYMFYAVGCDNAGNWEAEPPAYRMVKTSVDITPPVSLARPGSPSSGQEPVFIAATTPMYIDTADGYTGVNTTFYYIDEQGVKKYASAIKEGSPGSHNMTFWCTDKAGNTGETGSLWFFVDADPPVTSLTFKGPNYVSGDNVFVTAATSISFTTVDNASGANWTEYNLEKRGYMHYTSALNFTFGNHSLLYRGVDNVGNVEDEKSMTVRFDAQPPVTRLGGVITEATNSDLTMSLTATDSDCGVAKTYFRVMREKAKAGDFQEGISIQIEALTDGSADGNYTIEYYSVDKLNNTEIVKATKVRIDTQIFLQMGFNGTPTVNVDRFTIEGRTEQGARVTITGEKAELRSDGRFSYDVGLEPGMNDVQLMVTDSAGNTLNRTVRINYVRPATAAGWLPAAILLIVAASVALAGIFLHMNKGKRTDEKARPPRRASRNAGRGPRRPPAQ